MRQYGTYDPDAKLIQRPGSVLAWVVPSPAPDLEYVRMIERLNRGLQKHNRKLQDKINRLRKFIPGASRVWRMHEIAAVMHADAAEPESEWLDVKATNADALFLERMAYDMETLRQADNRGVRGDGTSGKYDPTQWPRGERP